MKRPGFAAGLLAGLLLTAPLAGLFYLSSELLGLAFAPFSFFEWLARTLPGGLVTLGIDLMVNVIQLLGLSVRSYAKTAEYILALAMFVGIGTAAGGLAFAVAARWVKTPARWHGPAIGAVIGLPLGTIVGAMAGNADANPVFSAAWTLIGFVAWGAVLGWLHQRLSPRTGDKELPRAAMSVEQLDRRRFLVRMGATSAAVTVVGAGLGSALSTSSRRTQAVAAEAGGEALQPGMQASFEPILLPNADDSLSPAPGTRPEYTPLEDHYRIDINLQPPVIDEATWRLPVTGLVGNPLELTLDDIRNNFESRHQFVTLSCISNEVGGDLISTTRWTGVRVQDILDAAQVDSSARYLRLTSADGFHEMVDLNVIREDERVMFAYAWDGKLLEAKHGFPLRVYIPDRYGMKQPKWIIRAELLAQFYPGYWVERGWDAEARARATAVIDTVAVEEVIEEDGQMVIPVGGIAWCGARGISRVEVRVDDGAWAEAELRSPMAETTWVIWRIDWLFEAGNHTLTVRCYEGDGSPQIEQRADVRPSGATGYHSRTARVSG